MRTLKIEAVSISNKGRSDSVSFLYEECKNMKSRIELLEILEKAEDDVENRCVAPISDTMGDLRTVLQP